MNLIDRYIAEVGQHLPRKNRVDIEAEIRSTLEDMLEERKQDQCEVDDETIIALLKEYGRPREVAESYTGPRYLIGPRVYPIFELVTKIVTAVLLAVALAGLGIGLAKSDVTGLALLQRIGEWALDSLGWMIAAFGNIVLTFAILERVLPAKEFEEEEEWNPAELTSEPDPDEVKFGEQISSIIFTAAFLIVLNLYPNLLGFGFIDDGEWVYLTPILSDAFFKYMPWINLLGLVQIVLSIILLRQRLWQSGTRIAHMAVELGNIALAVVMLRGPDLIALRVADFAGTPLADSAPVFVEVARWSPVVALTVIIIVSSIGVAQSAYRLTRNKSMNPYQALK
jgi:hypothetical protein